MSVTVHFLQIVTRIIREQELVIGPLAWDEARKVDGVRILDIRKEDGGVDIQNGDPKGIINKLVARYERLFGRASVEVCRDAVQDILAEMPPEEVPESLK